MNKKVNGKHYSRANIIAITIKNIGTSYNKSINNYMFGEIDQTLLSALHNDLKLTFRQIPAEVKAVTVFKVFFLYTIVVMYTFVALKLLSRTPLNFDPKVSLTRQTVGLQLLLLHIESYFVVIAMEIAQSSDSG